MQGACRRIDFIRGVAAGQQLLMWFPGALRFRRLLGTDLRKRKHGKDF